MKSERPKRSCRTRKNKTKYTEEDDETFEVEKILDRKKINNRIVYLLKWKGYPDSENSWVKRVDLTNCSELIKKFENKINREKKALEKEEKAKKDLANPKKNILKEKITTRVQNVPDYSFKGNVKATAGGSKHKRGQPPIKNTSEKKDYTYVLRKSTENITNLPIASDLRIRHIERKSTELNESEATKKRHNDLKAKHTRKKSVERNEFELAKKIYDDYGSKHTENKKAVLKERVINKQCDDPIAKHTGTKKIALSEHEIARKRSHDHGSKHYEHKKSSSNKQEVIKKRSEDHGFKNTENRNSFLKEQEIIKKQRNDLAAKNKKIRLSEHEIARKRSHDHGFKHIENKNILLREQEVIEKKSDDHRPKHSKEKNALNEREVINIRCDDHGPKHTKEKNALKEREVINIRCDGSIPFHENKTINKQKVRKKRRDYDARRSRGKENPAINKDKKKSRLSQKLNEVAQKCKQGCTLNRSKDVPKIQKLHYFVQSKSFPKNRAKGSSIMSVTFKGSNVLKGFEQLVEAGIAVGPLPADLYDKPVTTGTTDFTIIA